MGLHMATSLLLHVRAWTGATNSLLADYGVLLFRYGILLWMGVLPFVRNSVKWLDQIKECPTWMWRSALALGLYSILFLFRTGSSGQDTLRMLGFPLAFDAISLCVLYAVLRSPRKTESDIVRQSVGSLIMMAVCVSGYMAYKAGYFHHPEQ